MSWRERERPERGPAGQRVRWDQARPDGDRDVLVEFLHSPDYMPVRASVDNQPDHVGLVEFPRFRGHLSAGPFGPARRMSSGAQDAAVS